MIAPKNTFFAVVRVNPSQTDIKRFIDECIALRATCYGYSVKPKKNTVRFEGVIVLEKHHSYDGIERRFPNFLLTRID
jgi:hypothetical protein